jgi:hypothetical protein
LFDTSLSPGRYRVEVLGIDGREFLTPIVVTVVSRGGVANTPAPIAVHDRQLRPVATGTSKPERGSTASAPPPEPHVRRAATTASSAPYATAPPTTSMSSYSPPTPPPALGDSPGVLPVTVSFRTQADHMDATRSLVSFTLTVKNTTDATFNDTIVSDIVTVNTPDGDVHANIASTMPRLVMKIAPNQTWSARLLVQFGSTSYVDGGVVGYPAPLGAYILTYVFVDKNGARTPSTSFTLQVQ